MRILLVADGRSPITRRWVQGLRILQHQVDMISSFPCEPIEGVENIDIFPVAFSGLGGTQAGGAGKKQGNPGLVKRLVARYRPFLQSVRNILGPAMLPLYARRFRQVVKNRNPDIVHALRIPYEGMLASYTPLEYPLIISIWGNDLTLHADKSRWMKRQTWRTLKRANGLIADVNRDLRLSAQWGFNSDRPALVAPTSGGIDLTEMNRKRSQELKQLDGKIPTDKLLVVNPRGLRPSYVRNDVFFQSIPLLLERWSNVFFVCPSMADQPEALHWIRRLGIEKHVALLPYLSQEKLWDLFLHTTITVSPAIHDGTPNTLLEAMALGCFPIAGDIESLREWIVPGVNGLLVDPSSPEALADALWLALDRSSLRARAAEKNFRIIQERAEVNLVRTQVEVFLQRIKSGEGK